MLPKIKKNKLIYRNNRLDIIEPTDEELNQLSRILSVYDDYSNFPRVLWRAVSLRTEDGIKIASVPKFISRASLSDIFKVKGAIPWIPDSITPCRVDIESNGEPNSDIQHRAIEYLFPNGSRYFDQPIKILDIPVGSGKTFLSINAISRIGVKANIFVQKSTMVDNPWIKDILKFTDIKREEIGIIQGYKSVRELMKDPGKYKIFITLDKTFSSLVNNSSQPFDLITEIYSKLGIGMNVIDEAHLEILAVFLISINTRVKFTLYLSATLGKTDKSEQKLFYKMVPVRSSFSSSNFVEAEKFVTYIPLTYRTEIPQNWTKKFTMERGVKLSTYCEFVEDSPISLKNMKSHILRAIDYTAKKLGRSSYKGLRVAIILGKLTLVEEIINFLRTELPEDITIGNFTGLVSKKEKSNELAADIIVSTEKSMNAALDTPLSGMILCITNTSDILLTQLIGRVRKTESSNAAFYPIYDIVDIGNNKLKGNFNARKRVITRSIAAEVSSLEE